MKTPSLFQLFVHRSAVFVAALLAMSWSSFSVAAALAGRSQRFPSPEALPSGLNPSDWDSIVQQMPITQQQYLKAANTDANDQFSYSVAVSGDTVVVGAWWEDSAATGVNGMAGDNTAPNSGAAYVFVRSGTAWSQQAYLKASNTEGRDLFGFAVAVSGDTAVVGAFGEDSAAAGVNGDPNDNSAPTSGAAYVFTGLGPPPDTDGDGVPDAEDECPDTPPGAVTDATGCSVDQLVPCDGPWRNHGEYVRALHAVTSHFVREGLLTSEQARVIFLQGVRSDCGKK